jgi:hypothetical protein
MGVHEEKIGDSSGKIEHLSDVSLTASLTSPIHPRHAALIVAGPRD